MQIEGVDAQHDEESQGAGIEREIVAKGRLAEQQNGEHEGGAHQGGRQTREEGVAPEGDGDDEIADPSPTEGKHVLEGKKLEHQNDDADMEARQRQHVADSCMGVGGARFFWYVGFSSDGHGFDDVDGFLVESVVFVDVVEMILILFGKKDEALATLAGLGGPVSVGRVGSGADAVVEQVTSVEIKFTPPIFGFFKMFDVGKNGVAQLQRGEGAGVVLRFFPVFSYI